MGKMMDRFRLRSVGHADRDLIKVMHVLDGAIENMGTACDYPEDGIPPTGGREVLVVMLEAMETVIRARRMIGELK